jgi:hypothetical protein
MGMAPFAFSHSVIEKALQDLSGREKNNVEET